MNYIYYKYNYKLELRKLDERFLMSLCSVYIPPSFHRHTESFSLKTGNTPLASSSSMHCATFMFRPRSCRSAAVRSSCAQWKPSALQASLYSIIRWHWPTAACACKAAISTSQLRPCPTIPALLRTHAFAVPLSHSPNCSHAPLVLRP